MRRLLIASASRGVRALTTAPGASAASSTTTAQGLRGFAATARCVSGMVCLFLTAAAPRGPQPAHNQTPGTPLAACAPPIRTGQEENRPSGRSPHKEEKQARTPICHGHAPLEQPPPLPSSIKHSASSATASTTHAARPLPTLAWAALGAAGAGLAYPAPAAASSAAAAADPPAQAAVAAEGEAASVDVYAPPDPPPSGLPAHVTLYQYEVCPFCCKAKAALDFYGVPYTVVEVSPLTKRQLKWGPHRKVPVAVLDDGSVVADSSAIVSRLAAGARAEAGGKKGGWLKRASPSSSTATTTTPDGGDTVVPPPVAEAAWRRWVDGRLVRVLTLNIYRTPGEAWQAFDYITEAGNFGGALETGAARVVGAGMMWAIAGRLASKYGIAEAPRDALASVGREWVGGALGGGARPFAGGVAGPDLADLSAFGVWRAVRGTDTFSAAMEGNPALAAWYGRMEGAVGPSARVEEAGAEAATAA